MGDYKEILKDIRRLESMLPSGLLGSGKADWKAIWSLVKEIGANFKGSIFPTKEEHQAAWDRFQSLVTSVKRTQDQERSQWNHNRQESERLKSEIIAQSYAAQPPSGFADAILSIVTGGISSVISAIMGPFDERKRDLENASNALKEGWSMLHRYKDSMTGQDKQEAFQALNRAKERLDNEWNTYKIERQRAYNKQQHEWERKKGEWLSRAQDNIRNLEDRRERLSSVLLKIEAHLSSLYDKLSDAGSDDYRSRVSGWIDEEQEKIREIKRKLENVENWLYEAREKLRK